MPNSTRREFLRVLATTAGASATLAAFPPAIRKALAIPAKRVKGTLEDVEHIVILMQENRSFDHYFGVRAGVRGFGDRFPIPVPNAPGVQNKTVWSQVNAASGVVAPFRLNTNEHFEYMRVEGTPHTWPDAQHAWSDGALNQWPRYKTDHALGYFTEDDLPFQYALADAFTLCDAYHCSFHGGTNPNRLFLWTGTNDPLARGKGPALTNDYDNLEHDPAGGYTWTTYCERLQAAGVSWQVYEDMADNFTDNPLAGFRTFRDAVSGVTGAQTVLAERGLSTRALDKLKEDVLADRLPLVSFIVATAEGSEHPGPSSPVQGAAYTAQVLEALTANPTVWSKSVLLLMFDENDGFFDHVPPPAVPSYEVYDANPQRARLAGASTVDTKGEYHELGQASDSAELKALLHKPYGMGPRVPLYVVSPWSKGGFVNSQVFDHTSVIRFVEKRFGVKEPNISAFRRAVSGDLTTAFNFADPDNKAFYARLPETTLLAERARALPSRTTPPTPDRVRLPEQERGVRPSRALPYELSVQDAPRDGAEQVALELVNSGKVGAVFHVYDRLHLDRVPRRYVVEAGKKLLGRWNTADDAADYDLWVLGPNGFHRHFVGNSDPAANGGELPKLSVGYDSRGGLVLTLSNPAKQSRTFKLVANAYLRNWSERITLGATQRYTRSLALDDSGHWYDFTLKLQAGGSYARRFAGRVETGRDTVSDPALGGRAIADQVEL